MDQPDHATGKGPPPPEDGTVVQGLPEMAQTKGLSSPEIDLGDGDGTEAASPAEMRVSRTLSRRRPVAAGYQLLRPLGAGAFGEVWLAREEDTGIQVAIKFFAHGAGQQWKQLQEEVRQLGMMDSVKGIVQLKKVCSDEQPPYYVMAYAENGSLAQRLEKGPLKPAEALDLFRQVTVALDYVHAKGVRHCDLKPANILLDARGRALIADFGQAHLSSDASPVLGTFFYMAPEQADLDHQIPDTRWDVYGLGALFYAMVTGRPPRENPELRAKMQATAELSHRLRRYRDWIPQAPPPHGHRRVRGMDRALAHIIERCLDVDPKKRLPNAGAVLALLKLRERRRRQRPLILFGLVAPLLLLAVMTWAEFSTNETTIDAAQTKLTDQLLESDRNSARLVANAVQENLWSHLNLLYGSAGKDSGTRELLADRDKIGAGDKIALKQNKEALEQKLRVLMGRSLKGGFKFSQAAVADRQGRVLAIINAKDGELSSRDPDTLDCKQFAWRDWFSGRGDQWEQMSLDALPDAACIVAPHVSDPYVSLPDKYMFVNISIPVPAPGKPDAPPAGVLTAAVKLGDIYQWLLDIDIKDGFTALLDRRRFCLLHQNKDMIQPEYRKAAPQFDFHQLDEQIERDRTAGRLSGRYKDFQTKTGGVFAGAWMGPLHVLPCLATDDAAVSGRMEKYHDPVDCTTYLAGYAETPDPEFGWVALVQHERAAVLKPMDELRGEVRGAGWRMLGLAALLTTVLWGWLFWTLRRTER